MTTAAPTAPRSLRVGVGTPDLVKEDPRFPNRVTSLVNTAFGHARLDPVEVFQRLSGSGQPPLGEEITRLAGAAGHELGSFNRVLHLAWMNEELVGCCSSTIQAPWTPGGCGHWGLVAVTRQHRGCGVASALVAAAERRLTLGGCSQVQIEYEYTPGDAFSQRLLQWYERRGGFVCESGPPPAAAESSEQTFRVLRKPLLALPESELVGEAAPDVRGGVKCAPNEREPAPRAAGRELHDETKAAASGGSCVRCDLFCGLRRVVGRHRGDAERVAKC